MPSMFDFDAHIGEMTTFAKIWEHIASPTFRRTLLEEIGKTAVALVEQEFVTGRDPYGKRWTPHRVDLYWAARHSLSKQQIKRFRVRIRSPRTIGVSRILYKSGALAGSISYKAEVDQVKVFSPLKYSQVHQRGGKHVPQRLIFPEDLIGLPERWKKAFDGAAVIAFQRLLINSAFG